MLRKLFGRGDPRKPADEPRAAWPHDAATERSMRRQLVGRLMDYGIDPGDSRVAHAAVDELLAWSNREQEAFRREEQVWWETKLSREEQKALADAIARVALGGVPTYPYVMRPMQYSAYSGYRDISLATSRRLTDRGLAVAKDARSRHFILLSGIEREWAFDLADDPVSNQRLLSFAEQLRANRPAAEKAMLMEWDDLPPNRGEEYDAMPFKLEDRRIRFRYRQRNDDPAALDQAVVACRDMIARSPEFLALFQNLGRPLPTHKGFEQLAIILDKRKEYGEAIGLCRQAAAEGWAGDWDKRIERYQKKLDKRQA